MLVLKYSNAEVLAAILQFTKEMLESEIDESGDHDGLSMDQWELNKTLFEEINADFEKLNPESQPSDIINVRPHRSQLRSVIIFGIPILAIYYFYYQDISL